MENSFDAIVIGGSANGSQVANVIASKGHKVAVIEEHPTTGLPEHCSGLFSYYGLERLDCMPPSDIIFNDDIYGSRIVSPNGKILTVKKPNKHAIVCDRAAFDRFLLDRAIQNGCEVFQPYRAVDATRKDGKVIVNIRNSDGDITQLTTSLLISAEGIRGEIATQLGIPEASNQRLVNAAQFYMNGLNEVDPQLVEVYQSQQWATNFFAWVIPMSDDSAKVGLGTSNKHASKELEKMISTHPVLKERCDGAEIRRKTAGRIPISGPIKRSYADNLLLTGDVAGQTKPTTGGGVILGGIAAQIAGNVASDSIKNNQFQAQHLKKYEKLWKKEIHSNLKKMQLVRNYMNRLSDNEVNQFFSRLETKGVLKDIEELGHVDNQGVLVKKFMRTLSLYPFYIKTSVKLIKSMI
ncbi:MAG: NAD(P)/FAD-dependent oxidoreductase [Candidatus Heimdallarchaeota archaeon]|nr:NAD(P)/FAD-dependent oxidoreductase [Candidatus Heimdallarchaeota archaeon]MDH5647758.1 NAD(P)/FAD-dependent oxidoreductase [Candidatus Heimdallarchaeota archaeon]